MLVDREITPRAKYKERCDKTQFFVYEMFCDNPDCGIEHTVEISHECVLPKEIKCFRCLFGRLIMSPHHREKGKIVIQRKLKITR